MAYQVWVDKDVCLSSGRCVANEPSAFRFDADQLAEPVDGAALDDARLLELARDCPSGAIRLRDGDRDVPVD